MSPEDRTYSNLKDQLSNRLDSRTLVISEKIITESLRLVISGISENSCTRDEYEDKLDRVQGNLVNFIALVVMQLQCFSDGNNEGPFIDLFEELLRRQNEC